MFYNFFSLPIHTWCKTNSQVNFTSDYLPLNTIFAFTLWSIWLNHNSMIFNNQNIPPKLLRNKALSHATKFFFLRSIPSSSTPQYFFILIIWTPASNPFVTINTDGSLKGNPGQLGASGLAWDSDGNWLWAFSLHLGNTNNTVAELVAIRKGLKLAWNRGYQQHVSKQTPYLLLNG